MAKACKPITIVATKQVVPVWRVGVWAVHACDDSQGLSLTHVPTGRRVKHMRKYSDLGALIALGEKLAAAHPRFGHDAKLGGNLVATPEIKALVEDSDG